MNLLFLRHARPAYPTGIYPDPMTMPLSALGRAESRDCIEAVRRFDPQIVLTSDFKRAVETAEIATSGVGPSPRIVRELRERVFYSLVGKSFDEIQQNYGTHMRMLLSGNSDIVELVGEESYDDARQRVVNFLWQLHREYGEERILAVSHGGPHAWIVGEVFGIDLRGVRTFNLGTACFSRFSVTEGKLVLDAMNLPASGVQS